MQQSEAIALIEKGITNELPQHWVDLGCGNGTFTFALASLLPPESNITAIDKTQQYFPAFSGNVKIDFRKVDFVNEAIGATSLDGLLMANSLHFVADKPKLIKQLEKVFKGDPKLLIVEYDTIKSNPWVPYPISFQKLEIEFTLLGYKISKLAQAPSRFGGIIYSAIALK
ncbi:Methyltransferase domain-containing protein [Mucilaginibacter gossypiicola]|uniref:Methyltransferase domain-containing protein n=1 Tax=Mucilaginibacter gossypiicola TaxID=551995 RepID=A0A1H7ZR99_9SPHI|nr:methyltransferase domain-containing protein [Mucilaginibacter gossypiicola]SEM60029.1 Methyltransferase domain-containing protein [Mucilaginibacter gossypiicola]